MNIYIIKWNSEIFKVISKILNNFCAKDKWRAFKSSPFDVMEAFT